MTRMGHGKMVAGPRTVLTAQLARPILSVVIMLQCMIGNSRQLGGSQAQSKATLLGQHHRKRSGYATRAPLSLMHT